MSGPVEDEGQAWALQLYVLYVVADELGSGAGPALLDAVLEPDAAAALWVLGYALLLRLFLQVPARRG